MKKIISVALAVAMIFVLSVPAFATTSSYRTTGATQLWAEDFDDLIVGSIDKQTLDTPLTSVIYGVPEPAAYEDAIKGGKAVSFNHTSNWNAIRFTGATLDFDTYNYWMMEFSIKVDDNRDITPFSQLLCTADNAYYFRPMKVDGTNFVYANEGATMPYVPGKWHHVVLMFAPDTNGTTLTTFIDGVEKSEKATLNVTKEQLNGELIYPDNYWQIIGGGMHLDDFNSWQSNTAYNPAAAGDVVSAITATDAVEVSNAASQIICPGTITTVAELAENLSVTAGTITYHNAAGTLIDEENYETTVPVDGMQIVAHSPSGVAIEVYTLASSVAPPADPFEVWAEDFDDLIVGNIEKQALDTPLTPLVYTVPEPAAYEDAVKGGKAVSFNHTSNWNGIRFTGAKLDFDTYNYWMMEFSIKVDDTHDIAQPSQMLSTADNSNYFRPMKVVGTNLVYANEGATMPYVPGKWHHVVLMFAPDTNGTTLTTFIDGVEKSEKATLYVTKEQLNGELIYPDNYWQITGGGIHLDDFNSWQSNTAYDPEAAGDVVSAITPGSGVMVDGLTIEWSTEATVADLDAKLAVTDGNTKTYHQADGTLITDTATALADGMLLAVHSPGGVALDVYTLKAPAQKLISSTVYEINYNDKTISGVPFMTPVADFMADITKVDDAAVFTVTGPYAGASSTVTVGNDSTWKIVNKTYYEASNFNNGAPANLYSLGGSGKKDYHFMQMALDGDALKGGTSIRTEFFDDGEGSHLWRLDTATILSGETVAEGDVINLEFNFKTGIYSAAYVAAGSAANVVLLDKDGGTIASGVAIPGAEYSTNEWMHFVVSWEVGSYNYTLYKDGKKLGVYTDEGIDMTKTVDFYMFASPDKITGNMYLDDIKLYKAATTEYDETYMSGGYYVTSDDLVVANNVIYLSDDITVADVMEGYIDTGLAVPVDATGTSIEDWSEMVAGDSFYLVAQGGDGASRVTKFTFASDFVEDSNVVTAAYKESGWIIGAAYDAANRVIGTKAVKLNDSAATIDMNEFAGEGVTFKAFLWDDSLSPVYYRAF